MDISNFTVMRVCEKANFAEKTDNKEEEEKSE